MTNPTAASCPVSYELVDHNVSRVTCILTIGVLGVIAAATPAWLALAFAVDYAIRAWTSWTSPMQWAAAHLARAARLPQKPSDKAPKQFAARIGFLFALTALVATPLSAPVAIGAALGLMFFNVLDGVFNFCVGCWMYGYVLVPLRARLAPSS